MKKITLSVLLSLLIFGSSVPQSFAISESEINTLLLQISALSSYLERIYQPPNKILSNNELKESVTSGITWLKNAQEPSGHFVYEYSPYEGENVPGEQMVRQAGALFVLGEVLRKDSENELDLSSSVTQAVDFFESVSKDGDLDGTKFRCIADSLVSTRCQLGATSLALIGLLDYLTIYPEEAPQYNDLLNDWKMFIFASQKESGGFRNTYRVGKESQSDAESSFSNGEALLALVRLDMYEKDGEITTMIDRTFSYLKDKEYDAALYLWIMAALKDRNVHKPNPEYITYTKDFTNWRISRTQQFKNTNKNYCAYSEGIVSAYSILEDNQSLAEQKILRDEIDYWNTKNLRLQITNNDSVRAFSENGILSLKSLHDPQRSVGGFLTSESIPTQRIDFTQHCVSTYLQTLVDIEKQNL